MLKGAVAARDRAAEDVLLELRVAPRPTELVLHRAVLVERDRAAVLKRLSIGCRVGILPERSSREQPYRAIVGRDVGLGLELRTRRAIVDAALDEVLHALIVLPVAGRGRVREVCARDAGGERLIGATLLARLGPVRRVP